LEDVDGGEDGCALIDWDTQLMMWSAQCVSPVQERLCNRMMALTWPEWTVVIAKGHTNDLLKHVGISEESSHEDEDEDALYHPERTRNIFRAESCRECQPTAGSK
jgi:hypothetical protein